MSEWVRCNGCGMRTSPQVKRFWGGTCPDCRAGFSTPEHLAEVRASIARAQEYFESVDEAGGEGMTIRSWGEYAAEVIAAVIVEHQGLPEAEMRKRISAA